MHNLKKPSFFLTKSTGAPQGDTLGRTKPLSTKSCNCTFNSFNSVGAILYGGIEIGAVPGNKWMANSSSRSGGSQGNSSRKTSGNSCTTGTSSKRSLATLVSLTCAKNTWQPFRNNFSAANEWQTQAHDLAEVQAIPREKHPGIRSLQEHPSSEVLRLWCR